MTKEKIEKKLSALGISLPKIIYYPLTDSTNERAKVYALENPEDTAPAVSALPAAKCCGTFTPM